MSRDFYPVFLMILTGHILFGLARLFYLGARLESARTSRYTIRAPFQRWMAFRAEASFIQFGEVLTFMAICLGTIGSLRTGMSYIHLFLAGIALTTIGVLCHISLRLTYGDKDYFRFEAFDHLWRPRKKLGFHRFIENPTYSIAHWPALGFAILTESSWGLTFTLFGWVVALIFHFRHGRKYALAPAVRGTTPAQPEPALTRRAS